MQRAGPGAERVITAMQTAASLFFNLHRCKARIDLIKRAFTFGERGFCRIEARWCQGGGEYGR